MDTSKSGMAALCERISKLTGIDEKIAEMACRSILDESYERGTPDSDNISLLVCCYVEAAKNDFSADDLRLNLSNAGCSETMCHVIVSTYEKHKHQLRKTLLHVGWHPPHVLKADWKLDYQFKGNAKGVIARPNYLIKLTVQEVDAPNTSEIAFSCDVERLQDLVWKLKEAAKTIQKAANQTL